jgi:exodeoxyribonuclease-5
MDLSKEQEAAVSAATEAVRDRQEFVLTGLAGTGKSVVLAALHQHLKDQGIRPVVVAPTAKAALVLTAKGLPAATIHSTAYIFAGTRKDENDETRPIFIEKQFATSCMLVDEASMVGASVVGHLRSQCDAIVWVGDHGQLPPVKSENPRLFESPDFTLTEIHRQAAGNPIIAYSRRMRNRESMQSPHPGIDHYVVRDHEQIAKIAAERGIDQLICATNDHRVSMNDTVRRLAGRGERPEPGDRVVCLHNNHRVGVFNGEQYVIEDVIGVDEDIIELVIDGKAIEARLDQFGNPAKIDTGELDIYQCLFDFGYAITCHKAQGSQWDHVGVVSHGYTCFRGDAPRWSYTAVTRAAEQLTIFH